jgi:hypothetical protein
MSLSQNGDSEPHNAKYNLFAGAAWRTSGLDPFELAIFLNLWSRKRDKSLKAWPSLEVLARETQIGRTKVFFVLIGLEKKGFVSRAQRAAMRGKHNVYTLPSRLALIKLLDRVERSPRERLVVRHVNVHPFAT